MSFLPRPFRYGIEAAAAPRGYFAATALALDRFVDALQVASSAAEKARPSTRKLSTLPPLLASDSQMTSGRLSAVEP